MCADAHIEHNEFQTGGVTLVSTSHAVHDTYKAFFPALLPVLIEKFSMTNTAAGFLSLVLQLPSLFQPLIGHLADRVNLKLLIILTPAITGVAMSLLSIAPSYGFLIFLLVLTGFSSACLHAVGPVLGSNLAENKLGRSMSFWMVGGELGRALGPIIVVTVIGYLTMDGLPWLMLAGILASLLLFGRLNSITTQPRDMTKNINLKVSLQNMRKIMLPLVVLIFTRSMVAATLTTFLPTYLTTEGSSTLWMAGASLTILEVAGMVGAFIVGGLSDRFGRRKMLVISYIATPIFMYLFIQTTSLWQIPLLILLGFFAISVVPVLMAIVLENSPNNRSFANGVYMAVSFIITALAVMMVGVLGDLVDLRFTFLVSAILLPFGLPFILLLPKSQKRVEL